MNKVNIYEIYNSDGGIYIIKNPNDDDCGLVDFQSIKNLLDVISNIAQDIMFDIYEIKYNDPIMDYFFKKDIAMFTHLMKKRTTIYEEIFYLVKDIILSAYINPVEAEDEPFMELYISMYEIKKILEAKLNLKS